ncbi:hypothetical protein LCGC14_0485450 [marine sediment metagenome]|uniref:Uncharacterized protein n=1 Tax=marine sediment metagenome TaxID=412755 RepID=A0A0F9UV53_9ZZZZ|nr:MAG: hypothetical protein Lokiarch_06550 [Candidatus Lokiarchaeum sp. GC14_75]
MTFTYENFYLSGFNTGTLESGIQFKNMDGYMETYLFLRIYLQTYMKI